MIIILFLFGLLGIFPAFGFLVWAIASFQDPGQGWRGIGRLAIALLCLLPLIVALCWFQYLVSHGQIDS